MHSPSQLWKMHAQLTLNLQWNLASGRTSCCQSITNLTTNQQKKKKIKDKQTSHYKKNKFFNFFWNAVYRYRVLLTLYNDLLPGYAQLIHATVPSICIYMLIIQSHDMSITHLEQGTISLCFVWHVRQWMLCPLATALLVCVWSIECKHYMASICTMSRSHAYTHACTYTDTHTHTLTAKKES